MALSTWASLSAEVFAGPPGHDNAPLSLKSEDWELRFSGFLRSALAWESIDGAMLPEGASKPDPMFAQLNARMNFDLKYKALSLRFGLEGAGGLSDSVGSQSFSTRDMYIDFKAHAAARLRLGKFKPPIDLENLRSETLAAFTDRSIVSTGGTSRRFNKTERNIGISPSRELGFSLYSDILEVGVLGFAYDLAITNGDGSAIFPNGNSRFAAYARVEAHVMDSWLDVVEKAKPFVSVALSAAYDNKQIVLADMSKKNVSDWLCTTEFSMNYKGIEADIEFFIASREGAISGKYENLEGYRSSQRNVSYGLLAQAAYLLPIQNYRFQFAYRFAFLEPWAGSTGEIQRRLAGSSLSQHAIALAYFVEDFPLILRLEYTLNNEANPKDFLDASTHSKLNNDLLTFAAMVFW